MIRFIISCLVIFQALAKPGYSAPLSHLQVDFNQVARSVRPCVVSITAVRNPQVPGPVAFKNMIGFVPPFQKAAGIESIGSGVLISGEGYIVTNYHVIKSAQSIRVTPLDDKFNPLAAQVVKINTDMDLAVLKIAPAVKLQAARLGNSDLVRFGDWVLAVGSAFGFEQTVTAGIISGLGRNLTIEGRKMQNLFQTDCAINKGNSGGPLVNMDGEVIAINMAIYAPNGVSAGVGFSIPINQVKLFIDQSIGPGQVQNIAFQCPRVIAPAPFVISANSRAGQNWVPFMPPVQVQAQGAVPVSFSTDQSKDIVLVAGQPVTSGWIGVLLSEEPGGLLVVDTKPGSPADTAGIQAGDLIVSCNGEGIKSILKFDGFIDKKKTGQRIGVAVMRGNKRRVFYLEVGNKA